MDPKWTTVTHLGVPFFLTFSVLAPKDGPKCANLAQKGAPNHEKVTLNMINIQSLGTYIHHLSVTSLFLDGARPVVAAGVVDPAARRGTRRSSGCVKITTAKHNDNDIL